MEKCPVCKHNYLKAAEIENGLPALECAACGGVWLRSNEYLLWVKTQTPGTFDESQAKEASQRYPVRESEQALLCPDCGYFLRKHRISSEIEFHLDRCNHCNGVWLDKNEWETLKAADLHDEINQMFTKPWQKMVKDKILAAHFDQLYAERFGEQDYQKVREVRAWLAENPNRSTLLAFLMDEDPYSA